MSTRLPALASLAGLLSSGAALAEVPVVATDITPVQSLVAQVMGDLGTPELIVRPGASPHGYAMRPSEARALQDAGAVFWIGPELEPWLEDAIANLAGDAEVVELIAAPGTEVLEFRQGATFAAHDHDHGEEAHDHGEEHDHDHGEEAYDHDEEHDHDHGEEAHDHDAEHDHDHGEEAHDHDAEHDHDHGEEAHDHDEEHDHGEEAHDHGHSHDGIDPHAWLDPENGKAWLDVIAATLGELDPENAETYAANAEAGKAGIDAAIADAESTLAPVGDLSFVVFHDAYQYYETRFGLAAAGAIELGDASDPSPARIEEVRDTVRDLGVTCVYSEPQFNQGLVGTVTDGTEAGTGVIDPLGTEIEPGASFYPELIRQIARDFADCGQ